MPKQKTSGIDNRNETSTFALGQKVGAKENTCVMPTGISTAEKTRLKASNGDNSRTRPVALRMKTVVEPSGFEPLSVDIQDLPKLALPIRRDINKFLKGRDASRPASLADKSAADAKMKFDDQVRSCHSSPYSGGSSL